MLELWNPKNGSGADEVVTVGRCWRLSLRVLVAVVAVAAAIICLTECFHACANRLAHC